MKNSLIALSKDALFSLRDLAPIVLVIAVFQVFVIKQPVSGLLSLVFGGLLVVAGLAFFIFGLRLALFPIGEGLAHALARERQRVLAVHLCIRTWVRHDDRRAGAARGGRGGRGGGRWRRCNCENNEEAIENYALGLRLVVALSVGVALILGVFRILTELVAAD